VPRFLRVSSTTCTIPPRPSNRTSPPEGINFESQIQTPFAGFPFYLRPDSHNRWRVKKCPLDRDILHQDKQGQPTVLVVDDAFEAVAGGPRRL
jgi:hypothetical protein